MVRHPPHWQFWRDCPTNTIAMPISPGPLQLDPKVYPETSAFLRAQARAIRRWVLTISGHAKTGHVGSTLSLVDLLTVLYYHTLRVDPARPEWTGRDRLILSKGHAAVGLYVTLAARGFFPESQLWDYLTDGSRLTAHANTTVPGVELSTGSLGHGLPVGVGMAFGAMLSDAPWRTVVILSDGECNEGSTWEAVLAAGNLHLEHLVAIVDCNHMQALGSTHEVMELEPLADKWSSFGWAVREVNGHDVAAVGAALAQAPFERGKPSVLIAQTQMGKGISFMEGKLEWHYLKPSPEHVAQGLEELSDPCATPSSQR